jgi:hypothetical protein
MLLASVYKAPLRAWRNADITELLKLRTKSILAGDLNATHPAWNSKDSSPSGLKLLNLFVNCNLEISAPQHATHFIPNGRGDVLDILVHKDIRLSEVRFLDIMNSEYIPIMFCILDHIKAREILDPVKNSLDWEVFQILASANAARDFAASIASAYGLSTKTTRI